MAIKNSNQGSISFSEIKNEFGDSNGNTTGISLGKYRVSETYGEMSNMPLDEGIPQGDNPIGMSDFYGKRLNVVVNYFSGGTENLPETGKQRYLKQGHPQSECVGEFKDPPQQTTGSKVWIHVNKTIGSAGIEKKDQSASICAFKTGNWQSGTDLRVHVGAGASIYGKGGTGGNGGQGGSGSGQQGSPGSSAIGIQFSNGTTILTSANGAVAAGGGGGGGGGGAARQEDRGNDRKAGGGGGGGGFGIPVGDGGEGGTGDGRYASGGGGQEGTVRIVEGVPTGAAGGGGGDNDGEARAGKGGTGGIAGATGNTGGDGSGNKECGEGAAGGAGGNWIRTSNNSVQSQGWQGQSQGQYSSGDVT